MGSCLLYKVKKLLRCCEWLVGTEASTSPLGILGVSKLLLSPAGQLIFEALWAPRSCKDCGVAQPQASKSPQGRDVNEWVWLHSNETIHKNRQWAEVHSTEFASSWFLPFNRQIKSLH